MKSVLLPSLALVCVSLTSAVAVAQPLPFPPVPLLGKEAERLSTPAAVYPEAARAAGHQGDVWVNGLIQLDGTVAYPYVATSSRAPELDQAALDAFSKWTFKPALTPGGVPTVSQSRFKFEFHDDTADTLPSKTCAAFVRDQDWWTATWPNDENKGWLFYSSWDLMVRRKGGGEAGKFAVTRAFPAAFEKTYATCRTRPTELFVPILAEAL